MTLSVSRAKKLLFINKDFTSDQTTNMFNRFSKYCFHNTSFYRPKFHSFNQSRTVNILKQVYFTNRIPLRIFRIREIERMGKERRHAVLNSSY